MPFFLAKRPISGALHERPARGCLEPPAAGLFLFLFSLVRLRGICIFFRPPREAGIELGYVPLLVSLFSAYALASSQIEFRFRINN